MALAAVSTAWSTPLSCQGFAPVAPCKVLKLDRPFGDWFLGAGSLDTWLWTLLADAARSGTRLGDGANCGGSGARGFDDGGTLDGAAGGWIVSDVAMLCPLGAAGVCVATLSAVPLMELRSSEYWLQRAQWRSGRLQSFCRSGKLGSAHACRCSWSRVRVARAQCPVDGRGGGGVDTPSLGGPGGGRSAANGRGLGPRPRPRPERPGAHAS